MDTEAKAIVLESFDERLLPNVNSSALLNKMGNIFYVPEFGYSILSVSQMILERLQVSFENFKSIGSAGPQVVATASLVGD